MQRSNYNIGFRSQENEITLDGLLIQGSMPDWLKGDLIRTAPSKFEVGTSHYRHWFDGLAMLHKFSFGDAKVKYACRFLQSDAYKKALKKNKIVYGEFGTDPCKDLFQRVFSFFRGPVPTDNGCVNINQYGTELTATTESTRPVSFQLDNLETKGPFNYDDKVAGQITVVHPHYDKNGTLFSYMTSFGYKSKYNVYSQSVNSNKRDLICAIPVNEPAYMHSLGMTENYIILTEFPIVANSLGFRFSSKPFIENYKWKPEKGTKVHLIEKRSGTVTSFESEPYFAFHHVNAFELDNEVIFDIAAYKDAGIIDQLYLHHLRSDQPADISGELWRFSISPSAKKVARRIVSNVPIELPRINYAKVNGRPYQYVYGTGVSIPGNFLDNITKIDVNTGQATIWHKEDHYPGEPVFVERPGAQTEDDGLLLSIVLDTKAQSSFLLVLDAKDLREIARALVPQHICFGFHGQYVKSTAPNEVVETIHR